MKVHQKSKTMRSFMIGVFVPWMSFFGLGCSKTQRTIPASTQTSFKPQASPSMQANLALHSFEALETDDVNYLENLKKIENSAKQAEESGEAKLVARVTETSKQDAQYTEEVKVGKNKIKKGFMRFKHAEYSIDNKRRLLILRGDIEFKDIDQGGAGDNFLENVKLVGEFNSVGSANMFLNHDSLIKFGDKVIVTGQANCIDYDETKTDCRGAYIDIIVKKNGLVYSVQVETEPEHEPQHVQESNKPKIVSSKVENKSLIQIDPVDKEIDTDTDLEMLTDDEIALELGAYSDLAPETVDTILEKAQKKRATEIAEGKQNSQIEKSKPTEQLNEKESIETKANEATKENQATKVTKKSKETNANKDIKASKERKVIVDSKVPKKEAQKKESFKIDKEEINKIFLPKVADSKQNAEQKPAIITEPRPSDSEGKKEAVPLSGKEVKDKDIKEIGISQIKKPTSQGCDGDKRCSAKLKNRPSDQAIRSPINGSLKGANNLSGLMSLAGREVHFQSLSSSKDYGTYTLVNLIDSLANEMSKLYDGYKLVVRDMAAKFGKNIGHDSHKNGLDADIGYILKKHADNFVLVADNSKVYSNLDIAKTWHALNYVSVMFPVNVIYVGPAIKKAMCNFTSNIRRDKSSEQAKQAVDTLRKLRTRSRMTGALISGHNNHFHVRLKCSAYDPQCRNYDFPEPTSGCQ